MKTWKQWEWELARFVAAHGVEAWATSLVTGAQLKECSVSIGDGDMHKPDVIGFRADGKRVIVEAKWQFGKGTTADKIFRNLEQLSWAVEANPDIVHGYMVLGGPAWSDSLLRQIRRAGEHRPHVTVYHGYEELLAHGMPHLRPDLASEATAPLAEVIDLASYRAASQSPSLLQAVAC